MADTGWVIAGSGYNYPSASEDWTSPGNITADDNVSAATANYKNDVTDYLVAYNFGFSIPVGATINGIETRVQANTNGGTSCVLSSVNAGTTYNDNGTWGTPESPGDTLTTSMVDYDDGGPSTTFGLSLSYSDINSSNFCIAAQLDNNETFTSRILRIDAMWAKVHYTEAGSGPGERSQVIIML